MYICYNYYNLMRKLHLAKSQMLMLFDSVGMLKGKKYATKPKQPSWCIYYFTSFLTMMCFFFVMMQLGVIKCISFGGVCNSWRSFTLCTRNVFMASKTPMSICIYNSNIENKVYLADFKGRIKVQNHHSSLFWEDMY